MKIEMESRYGTTRPYALTCAQPGTVDLIP